MNLDKDDVVSVDAGISFVGDSPTFTVGEAASEVADRFGLGGTMLDWAKDGVPCRVLCASGGGWKSGKVRFSLEFVEGE